MKNFNYLSLEFQTSHTINGSFVLPVKTTEQENYKKKVSNHISKFLKTKSFYDLNSNNDLFEFMNSYITFNKKNSIYHNLNEVNPYKATMGVFSKEKHAIFDSLLPLGFVLSTRHRNNKNLLNIPKTYKIDDYEYDKIFNQIYSNYCKQLNNFKTNSYINCYLENLMLVSLIEKLLKNGLYAFLVRLLIKTIKTSPLTTKKEKEEAINIENGKFLGTFEVKVSVLLSIAQSHNLFPEYNKSFNLVINGFYVDDKGKTWNNTLDSLLDNKIIKKIFNKEFISFLKYIFKELNIRNDYAHMNTVWYRINNIMITSILIHIIQIIMAYFVNTEGNELL